MNTYRLFLNLVKHALMIGMGSVKGHKINAINRCHGVGGIFITARVKLLAVYKLGTVNVVLHKVK